MQTLRWFALLALGACSHVADVAATFPAGRADSGAVEVVLNDASRALSVTIDDVLVIDRKTTRKVHIDGVPAGTAHVRVATGGRCEQGSLVEQEVVVTPGQTATLALPGPAPNLGCMVLSGLNYVGMETGLLALAILVGETAHAGRALHVR